MNAPPVFLVRVTMEMTAQVYPPLETIREPGLYVIEHGIAFMSAGILHKGSLFGLDSLLRSEWRPKLKTRTMSFVDCYHISTGRLRELCSYYPSVQHELTRWTAFRALSNFLMANLEEARHQRRVKDDHERWQAARELVHRAQSSSKMRHHGAVFRPRKLSNSKLWNMVTMQSGSRRLRISETKSCADKRRSCAVFDTLSPTDLHSQQEQAKLKRQNDIEHILLTSPRVHMPSKFAKPGAELGDVPAKPNAPNTAHSPEMIASACVPLSPFRSSSPKSSCTVPVRRMDIAAGAEHGRGGFVASRLGSPCQAPTSLVAQGTAPPPFTATIAAPLTAPVTAVASPPHEMRHVMAELSQLKRLMIFMIERGDDGRDEGQQGRSAGPLERARTAAASAAASAAAAAPAPSLLSRGAPHGATRGDRAYRYPPTLSPFVGPRGAGEAETSSTCCARTTSATDDLWYPPMQVYTTLSATSMRDQSVRIPGMPCLPPESRGAGASSFRTSLAPIEAREDEEGDRVTAVSPFTTPGPFARLFGVGGAAEAAEAPVETHGAGRAATPAIPASEAAAADAQSEASAQSVGTSVTTNSELRI